MMGKSKVDELLKQKDSNGMSFEKVLISDGLSIESFINSRRNLEDIELYAEIHIEQGKRLEKANLSCGIVNGIAGPSCLRLHSMEPLGMQVVHK